MRCIECESEHVSKAGFKMTREGRKQKYQCQNCGRYFYKQEKEED